MADCAKVDGERSFYLVSRVSFRHSWRRRDRSEASLPCWSPPKTMAQAVALLEQALAAYPNDAESRYRLGQVLVMLDRLNEAITHYDRAVTIDPMRDDYHLQLGKALHRVGQDEGTVKVYQMSIDLDPSDPAPHLSLDVSCEGLRRWNDAVVAYQRYLNLAPASPTTTALKWHVVAIMENKKRARAGG
jgi:cytochrome c-type biogenesis protein CcmH/NrfG